ncbi:hypothetical protein ADUPG1_013513 [Aduncisulcus paluster]|uniref:Uncharacterized protein n=1 Tax=Aduncisulcus paluster TaxID=2918883 RepID=A0ABQ5K379_9EUKA|nr:hypothetical protein ADUPG1_013513 [Aduncisulcus paluster]|eukprot:gnl/Carplike_NY0171/7671_a10591_208.p1 GENE.gnl/Carplike_NY0171/7671_a10591_208~~gnl/Carplike_NY0171/7671_a10591_208.p1  ORF type:complete len:147 (-),score=23.02 gnl/Carplike_NY0171/7671_a10591_208:38-478(-)
MNPIHTTISSWAALGNSGVTFEPNEAEMKYKKELAPVEYARRSDTVFSPRNLEYSDSLFGTDATKAYHASLHIPKSATIKYSDAIETVLEKKDYTTAEKLLSVGSDMLRTQFEKEKKIIAKRMLDIEIKVAELETILESTYEMPKK